MPIEKEVKKPKTVKAKKAAPASVSGKKEAKKVKTVKTAKTTKRKPAVKKTVKEKKEISIKIDVAPKAEVLAVPESEPVKTVSLSPEQFNDIIAEEELKESNGINEVEKIDTTIENKEIVQNNFKAEEKAKVVQPEVKAKDRSIGMYRKISFAFVFLTIALLAIVFYFSFIKVNIVLTPNQERISSNLIFDIVDEESEIKPGSVGGLIQEFEVSESKNYKPVTSEVIGEEVVGKATIYNNYTKNQPLVASTRLMSADNKLYRIKNTVNIPAGGSAEIDIYADNPTEFMVVGPTKFTIPGLWAGLQDQIYAESKEPTVYQKQVKGIIGQSDIDEAVKDLRSVVLEKARAQAEGLGYDQSFYTLDENSVSITMDGKVGEEKEGFKAEIKAKVIAVLFKGESVKGLAQEKMNASISEDKEIAQLNADEIVYSLNSYDASQGVATVNANFDGKVALKGDAEIFDKNKVVGLTKDQLEQYLGSLPEVSSFDVKIWPSFITKVPSLINLDRINVEIRK